jgi:hypothetical protein
MTTGMILDKSFRLYVQNFALMIGVTAIVHVPILLLTVGTPLLRLIDPLLSILVVLIGLFVFLLTGLILGPLIVGAATKAVSERFLGNEITAMSALKFAWGHVGTLLLVQLVAGLIIAFGMFLLIVPGILWALSYSLIAPVTVLENHSDRGEIRRRSWDLVAGNRGKVFGVMVVVVLAQILLGQSGSLFIQLFFGIGSAVGEAFGALFSGIAGILIYPLQAIAITLLYYDLRIRKEGFDLEMLSRAIVSPESPA